MSQEMSSWKYLSSSASSRFSSFKGYIAQQDLKSIPVVLQRQFVQTPGSDQRQSWKDWAGQKIAARRSQGTNPGEERLALFPGWAAKRYPQSKEKGKYPAESFEVDVFVSGYVSAHRAPEFASRSQRAFMRLAKGFAALPKLEGDATPPEVISGPTSKSTEELLATMKLPPRPSEDDELEALERQFQKLNRRNQTSDSSSISSSSSDAESDPPSSASASQPSLSQRRQPSSAPSMSSMIGQDLRKLHANLEARLLPFWSSVLPNRTVRIHLFPSIRSHTPSPNEDDKNDIQYGPVDTQDVFTAADGSFQARFRVRWEDMCQHPGALHIAFGDPLEEHELLVAAQLLPQIDENISPPLEEPPPQSMASSTTRISLTHAPIRVISDIDDTVKHSNVLGGTRAIFNNVFVKELSELIIPGVGEWYTDLWRRGLRFHYVSNGPFEILPVLGEFFKIAQLPPGSLKLKSYAGRSLFSGLLSAPAARKRAGIQDLLDSFPDSRFILIGDTGEQDMELYAEFAYERPRQVLGVFIRQADSDESESLEDPTGKSALQNSSDTLQTLRSAPPILESPQPRRITAESNNTAPPTPARYAVRTPVSRRVRTPSGSSSKSATGDYFTYSSRLTSEPEEMLTPASSYPPPPVRTPKSASTASSGTYPPGLPEAENKRYDLQMRVYRARLVMPREIPLRVFRHPRECVEVEEILKV